MKADEKPKYEYSAEIIDFNLKKVEMKKYSDKQNASEEKPCFQTDQRYFCEEMNCACAKDCKKLIAEWMR